ncbi:YolD-like family protein [Cytobacillus kochii]|uniref:YolD-like family protein n=1 Tax=Cytobacillus kochii TaxID=859143 RepID=UPI001CD592F4|nr:YolD-like family protein [Cytobacillus kochii]MCA1025733.1 YolD-like family protein [Cytobacillus kochii]
MAIQDRGKKKWQGFFMTEHTNLLRKFNEDYYQQQKPILDSFEVEHIESQIHYAMEFSFNVHLKVWRESEEIIKGKICRLDQFKQMVYLEDSEGFIVKVLFDDVLGIEVEEEF